MDFLRDNKWRSRKWKKSRNSNHVNSPFKCDNLFLLQIWRRNFENNTKNKIFEKFSKSLINLLESYRIKPSLWVFGASDSFLSTLIYVCVFSKTCIYACLLLNKQRLRPLIFFLLISFFFYILFCNNSSVKCQNFWKICKTHDKKKLQLFVKM